MPITTTANDVILVGHGSYTGGADNFQLPLGVVLYIVQPVGSVMTDGPVRALVANRLIDRLILRQGNGAVDDLSAMHLPYRIVGPNLAPNLLLHDLGNLRQMIQDEIPKGPNHVILVDKDTRLRDLLWRDDVTKLIEANIAMGKQLNVYWAACTASDNNPNDPACIWHNAKAVAFAALAYMKKNSQNDAVIQAASAALDFAAKHPEDTQGTIAAAAKFDHTTADQTKPF